MDAPTCKCSFPKRITIIRLNKYEHWIENKFFQFSSQLKMHDNTANFGSLDQVVTVATKESRRTEGFHCSEGCSRESNGHGPQSTTSTNQTSHTKPSITMIPSLSEIFVTRHGEKTSQLIKYGSGSQLTSNSSSSNSLLSTPTTPTDANGDYEADPVLTTRGINCAKWLGYNFFDKYLKARLENDTQPITTLHVYTSPFRRCLQTCENMVRAILDRCEREGRHLNLQVFVDFGLMEFYGMKRKWLLDMMPPIHDIERDFKFLTQYIVNMPSYDLDFVESNSDEATLLNKENFMKYFLSEKEGYELMVDLTRRVKGTFVNIHTNVIKYMQEHNGERPTVCIVTHAATMIRVVEELLEIYHRIPISERINVKASICGLSHLQRDPADGKWKLITNNDISFMECNEQESKPRQYYTIDSTHYVNRK